MSRAGGLKLVQPDKAPGGKFYYIVGTHRGVRIRKSTGTDKRSDAEKLKQKEIDRIDCEKLLRQPIAGPDLPFSGLVIMYLMNRVEPPTHAEYQEFLAEVETGVRKAFRSEDQTRYVLSLLEYFGDTPRSHFNPALIQRGEEALYPGRLTRFSKGTLNRQYIGPLSAVLNIVSEEAEIPGTEPHITVRRYKEDKFRGRVLSDEQARKLIDAAEKVEKENFRKTTKCRFHALMVVLLSTGARISTLVALRKQDVILARKCIVLPITKNGDALEIPLRDEAFQVIAKCIADDMNDADSVFKFKSRWSVNSSKRKACKLAGVKFGVHDARRTLATNLNNLGVELPIIMAIGGWRSINAVLRYIQVSEQAARAAMDLLPKLTAVQDESKSRLAA